MIKSEFKRQLKTLGFKVNKCKFIKSWDAAQYIHIESQTLLRQNVFTDESLQLWQPLFDFLRSLTLEQKEQIKEEMGYRGLFTC